MGTSVFESHTVEQHTQSIANFLPDGRIFAIKTIEDSTFRKFISGLAPEFQRAEDTLIETSVQHDINCAVDFLELWERAVGIPDECFPGGADLDTRRLHVILKLAQMNISTEDEFIALAAKLGFTITIDHPSANSFPPYDIPYIPVPNLNRFTWIVEGIGTNLNVPPYDIPLFLDESSNILICVFEFLKPAMSQIIFLA